MPFDVAAIKAGISLALSMTFNPRNLESLWYIPWNTVLSNLRNRQPDLLVNPQCRIHDRRNEDEDDEDGEGDDDDASETGSITGVDGESIPDSAILLVTTQVSGNTIRYPGGRVHGCGALVLLEVKRYAARVESGFPPPEKVARYLGAAKKQVIRYARHAFRRSYQQDEFIVMAASGPVWTYAIVTRQQLDHPVVSPSWINPQHLRLPDSYAHLQEISDMLTHSGL